MMSQQEMLKKKAAIQKRINEKRIDDMQKTQQNLREKFIQVNDFMKECMRKTERAEEEIVGEERQQATLKEEIEIIERDLKGLSSFEEKFKEIVKEFQPYVDVFNEVIQASDFQSFEDLMSRCDSLCKFLISLIFKNCHLFLPVLAQVEIAEREQELIKGIELVRQKMVESTAKAAQRIIELNDELAELEVSINLIRRNAQKKLLFNSVAIIKHEWRLLSGKRP